MKKDKGYEVVDKRGPSRKAKTKAKKEPQPEPEEEPQQSVEPEQVAEEPQQEQAEVQAGAEETPDVYSVLGFFTSLLAEHAWMWMGLRMDPISHTMKRDLAQARIAIDTLIFLADKLAPKMEENERRDLRNAIGDLQLNFVQQSAKGE